jgi:hypothetical protein
VTNPINELGAFLFVLKARNETLFYFGLVNLVVASGLFIVSRLIDIEYSGTHALYKPIKFALSTTAYSWAMAWFCYYLNSKFNLNVFNWGVIIFLGFEVLYIAIQAFRKMPSHYNVSTPFYGAMFTLMALAATVVTLWTAYIGILFFIQDFKELPSNYLWGVRLGIFIFVIFSFEGFLMGSRMSHTVGASDGTPGVPFLNWSKNFGDLRIAHFFGMHALQVIPFLSFYILRSTWSVLAVSFIYFLLAVSILVMSLKGRSLV